MRKLRWVVFTTVMLLPIYFVFGQMTTERLILHDVWDRVNHRLMFSSWAGPSAQDKIETERTVFNDIWDPDTHSFRGSASSGGIPGDDTVGTAQVIDGSLTADDLATGSVGTLEIIDASVGADDLAPNSVDTSELVNTAVAPGMYGSATQSAQVTIDAKGRATLATNVPITAPTSNSLIDDELPLPCTLHTRIIITPGILEYFCFQDAVGETEENKRCNDLDPDAPAPCWVRINPGTNTTGIQYSDTEVTSLRFESLIIADTELCNLGSHSLVNVTAGANGKTCFLPDPALTDTVGYFRVYVDDANYLTIAPTSGALLNGATTAYPALKGPHAYYEIWRISNTKWHIIGTGVVGYGLPLTTICSKFGGDANTASSGSGAFKAHSLQCTIPAGKLKAGTELEVCNGWTFTTGATAPTEMSWRYSLGATYGTSVVLNNSGSGIALGNSLGIRNAAHCIKMMVKEEPSSASAINTMPILTWSHFTAATTRGSVAQPVDFNTTIALTIFSETQWNTAGTGVHTMTQDWLTVRASGLGD